MTSIERMAYPRFGGVMTARELEALSRSPEEIVWARERSRGGEHLLGLLVALKCFQRLGYFPRGDWVPELVVERVRDCRRGGTGYRLAHGGVAAGAGPRACWRCGRSGAGAGAC
jgi:hypothetical protein